MERRCVLQCLPFSDGLFGISFYSSVIEKAHESSYEKKTEHKSLAVPQKMWVFSSAVLQNELLLGSHVVCIGFYIYSQQRAKHAVLCTHLDYLGCLLQVMENL